MDQTEHEEMLDLPFFTLLNMFKGLEPDDLIHIMNTSLSLRKHYQDINTNPVYKFVYDTRIDTGIISLLKTNKIEHIYIDVNHIDFMGKMINIWKLINDQKFIKTLTILDQSFITRTLTRVTLTNRFNQT